MMRRMMAAAVLVAVWAPAGLARADGAWLDRQPIANWNKPGAAIPKAPAADGEVRNCLKRGEKPKTSAETRQVARAGWLGATVDKRLGGLVFVHAANGADGMCRPLAYQVFVFRAGSFVGTVSPRPMDSRGDGAGYEIKPAGDGFTQDFARYTSADALCCPGRTSTVTYAIRPEGKGAVLVPVSVATRRNP